MVTDYAVFIDDVCFRQQVYPIQIVHFFLRIEHDRESNFYWKQPSRFIRNRDIADKRINLLRSLFISTEGQHLERQAFCFHVLVKALHRGKLLPAGSACRGPDVKHNNLTTISERVAPPPLKKGRVKSGAVLPASTGSVFLACQKKYAPAATAMITANAVTARTASLALHPSSGETAEICSLFSTLLFIHHFRIIISCPCIP